MLMWIFTIIVYVFFIYGLIELFKKICLYTLFKNDKFNKKSKIKIIVDDADDIEYYVRMLKDKFEEIEIIFSYYSLPYSMEELGKKLQRLSDNVIIKIKSLEDLSKM